ncbi:glycosyltransferase [Calothrix sp. UHCC 0171]|uniref:glycosyltransferase n=1 Tax=Calothrix sp. UHCC 0171 TaxID=3110245 RepID=UPI002B1E9308|nr:glycosyltransferase [Calothrix sp. UHCC 0171]MEA5571259.1 glycosyltransferase [Calothrix sp. UHCC 0171]
MKIAYLINKYPKVSHSFIRREIAALEKIGLSVARFSIRSCESELVDPKDKLEFQKTQIVLGTGLLGLLVNLFSLAIFKPFSIFRSMRLALKIGWKSDAGVLRHLVYLAEACVLWRWLQREQVTHLHAHFGTNPTTVAMLCNAIGGVSYSFTVHGPEEFDRAENIALTEKINRAKFVVAICSFGRSQLYRWCDYQQWHKIHLVRCGVDEEYFNQPEIFLSDIPADIPNLVCVGRLCEQKGQILLLQAVKRLAEEGLDLVLTLVGDGELRSQIEALICDYGLGEQVKITGWASGTQVQKYITNARALILPSFAEGLPVVLMEAFALHRPVVSTYVAGIPELVQSDVNGWLVPAGSVEELTSAIRQVLQMQPDELNRMGRAGTISVTEKHNVLQEAQKLARLFHLHLDDWEVKEKQEKLEVGFTN